MGGGRIDSGMTWNPSRLPPDARMPLPRDVTDQRRDPFFAKYPVSGRTYTTASGTRIPIELQYYDGEMVHFYGECANVSGINDTLAGSGYKAVTLRGSDGRQTAVAQLWSNRFTDTTIGPYGAMFIVVIVVPEDAPPGRSTLRADPNGASSVLVMLDGTFDPASATYENRARLFMVRLLDSTQVAIDVGRERMGTDKRRGTVDVVRSGRKLRVSILNQDAHAVMNANLELADDPTTYGAEVARAASTAGIPWRTLPAGTEYVYPAVARIGRGPVVSWQWRSDQLPVLQRVMPGTVTFHSSSEEGRLLLAWGFTPRVLGYMAHVRGVITGLAEPQPSREGRVALGETPAAGRATYPGDPGHARNHLPILRLVADHGSPHAARPAYPVITEPRDQGTGAGGRWPWNATFLGSLTADLRKEVVGDTPDGLRIGWHVTQGRFAGPALDWTVLPGATDWTRVRKDGVGIVDVQACFEARNGARIHGSYGGFFDLGPDGYARALRGDFNPTLPVVVTPTFTTADAQLAWLNRVQCVGVGQVDLTAPRVEFDLYVICVGDRTRRTESASATAANLYSRLGGHDVIVAVTDDFVDGALADAHLGRFFPNVRPGPALKELKGRVVDLLCEISGGPCKYRGRDMKTAHQGLGINETDWQVAIDLFSGALARRNVTLDARSEFVRIIENMKDQIVEVRGPIRRN
jgi:truncated hemoglobin YjbI